MRSVTMKEVENKATIFLSAMETSFRHLVKERDTRSISQVIEERSKLLENYLNFAIVPVIVRDSEGMILDHIRPEKIGETYTTEKFKEVMDSGRPLIQRKIKTLKLEPGQPDVLVIEVIYPIKNRQKGTIIKNCYQQLKLFFFSKCLGVIEIVKLFFRFLTKFQFYIYVKMIGSLFLL